MQSSGGALQAADIAGGRVVEGGQQGVWWQHHLLLAPSPVVIEPPRSSQQDLSVSPELWFDAEGRALQAAGVAGGRVVEGRQQGAHCQHAPLKISSPTKHPSPHLQSIISLKLGKSSLDAILGGGALQAAGVARGRVVEGGQQGAHCQQVGLDAPVCGRALAGEGCQVLKGCGCGRGGREHQRDVDACLQPGPRVLRPGVYRLTKPVQHDCPDIIPAVGWAWAPVLACGHVSWCMKLPAAGGRKSTEQLQQLPRYSTCRVLRALEMQGMSVLLRAWGMCPHVGRLGMPCSAGPNAISTRGSFWKLLEVAPAQALPGAAQCGVKWGAQATAGVCKGGRCRRRECIV